jgi:hypothetical protein
LWNPSLTGNKILDSSSRSAKKRRIQEQESTTSGMSLADKSNKEKDKDETFTVQAVQFVGN